MFQLPSAGGAGGAYAGQFRRGALRLVVVGDEVSGQVNVDGLAAERAGAVFAVGGGLDKGGMLTGVHDVPHGDS
jgi:hypothetical protein